MGATDDAKPGFRQWVRNESEVARLRTVIRSAEGEADRQRERANFAELEAGRLREALARARDTIKAVHEFRLDEDGIERGEGSSPFGVCDHYAFEDLLTEIDALLCPAKGPDDGGGSR
jgi:hypothetical protein